MCVLCRGNFLIEPLPSNNRGIHIKTQADGRNSVNAPLNGLKCHDIYTKFHKDWFRHSTVDRGDTQTYKQHRDRIGPYFHFLKIRKSG
jgi:hypothetical protein